MLRKALPLTRSRNLQCLCVWQKQPYSSKAATKWRERTHQVEQEIKHLQSKHEARTQRRDLAALERMSEQDIAAVYQELAQQPETVMQPKIDESFLERLRAKFLDTRHTPLLSGSAQTLDQMTTTKKEDSLPLATTDFEQLIYANALAHRPEEAKRALDHMKNYGLEPSLKCYNFLIDAYANTRNVAEAIEVFKNLRKHDLEADIYTYAGLIKAFVQDARMADAAVLFEQLKSSGLVPTQPVFTMLIGGYIRSHQIDKAWETFDAMRLSYHQADEVSYTLMIHACAKQGEVERAMNLFEDMIGNQLFPTDVTFNVLINACAKRPDYYEEAFDLLHQMQTVYGFRPDRVTYNTLLHACAWKKDLYRARKIVNAMLEKSKLQEEDDPIDLTPNEQTFTNLFMCYANYNPGPQKTETKQVEPAATDALVEHRLLTGPLPERRSAVVTEAKQVLALVQDRMPLTTKLLTAYLAVHVLQKQSAEITHIYTDLFDAHQATRIPRTFNFMLRSCYDTKNTQLAWEIWEQYQDYLGQFASHQSHATLLDRKKHEAHIKQRQIEEGWTMEQQRQMLVVMVNTVARGDDIPNALKLLSTQIEENPNLRPKLKHLNIFYNKCIQLEDEEAKKQLVALCYPDRKLKPVDWRYRKQ